MKSITTSRAIGAPVGRVFETVATPAGFSSAVPQIVDIEYLSNQRRGAGTRFRETRIMRGKEAATVLEVTEFVENQRVRYVSDAGGTVWDTVFTVTPTDETIGDSARDPLAAHGNATRLTMTMEARPHKFLARLMTPLIIGVVAKAVEADMDAVKEYCEGGGTVAQSA